MAEQPPIPCAPFCYCIPDSGSVGICPSTPPSPTLADDYLAAAAEFALLSWSPEKKNPLNCQPYESVVDAGIVNEPLCNENKNENNGDDDAVCAFIYNSNKCTYKLKTIRNPKQLANIPNAVVTHEGPCGACSSAQDLSVYLDRSLGITSFLCGTAGLPYATCDDFERSQECFINLGLTEDCAYVWASNAANSALNEIVYGSNTAAKTCTFDCSATFGACLPPPTGVGPMQCAQELPFSFNNADCTLIDCLECDELNSGELFEKYAARTRRNSGILTAFPVDIGGMGIGPFIYPGVKRECSSIADIFQEVPDEFYNQCLLN